MLQRVGAAPIDIIDAHVWLGDEHHLKLDAPELIRRLDESKIIVAIARPMGAELAVFNTRGNDRVLSAGERVRGLVTANPWFGDEAIGELRRCHERGAVGLYLHPSRQGFMPTDPIVRPLLTFADQVRWPVVFHTGSYIQSDVLAVGEVARRNPSITFIADSAGFSDMWFELPDLMEQTPNLMLCASLIWGRAIATAVKVDAASRVMFGSGEPRDRLAAALTRIERLDLNETERQKLLCDNAQRVFRISN
jgi:predicted TIM-barrel fold metal-dependent hydrolase